jgi:hypothetical protein
MCRLALDCKVTFLTLKTHLPCIALPYKSHYPNPALRSTSLALQWHLPCQGSCLDFLCKVFALNWLPKSLALSCLTKFLALQRHLASLVLRWKGTSLAQAIALLCKGTSMPLNSLQTLALPCLDLQRHFIYLSLQRDFPFLALQSHLHFLALQRHFRFLAKALSLLCPAK